MCNEREFSLVEYTDAKGESRPEALLTKDGFILLCMNYQGYNDFKRAYINKFNEMERELNKIIWFANRELERIKTKFDKNMK